MKSYELINKRLSELKEKELTEGLSFEETKEIGRLYITVNEIEIYEELARKKEEYTYKYKYEKLLKEVK